MSEENKPIVNPVSEPKAVELKKTYWVTKDAFEIQFRDGKKGPRNAHGALSVDPASIGEDPTKYFMLSVDNSEVEKIRDRLNASTLVIGKIHETISNYVIGLLEQKK